MAVEPFMVVLDRQEGLRPVGPATEHVNGVKASPAVNLPDPERMVKAQPAGKVTDKLFELLKLLIRDIGQQFKVIHNQVIGNGHHLERW